MSFRSNHGSEVAERRRLRAPCGPQPTTRTASPLRSRPLLRPLQQRHALDVRASAELSSGATRRNRFMVHLALNEVDDDHPAANWGDKVTEEQYAAAPATEH